MSILKKATMGTVLAATALATTSPAMARDYYGYRHNDNTAAVAIGAGVIGLALGAIVASGNHDRDDRYYRNDGYYNNGWQYRDGYYYDRDGRRYDRDEYRRHQNDWRRGYNNDRDYYRRGY